MNKIIINKCIEKISNDPFLPVFLKEKLLDTLETHDKIYVYFPFLFNEQFNVEEDQVIELSIAGFYIYSSLIILDRIIDGDTQKNYINENLKNATLLQALAIRSLEKLFSNLPKFWNYWYQRRNEYFSATVTEDNIQKENSLVDWIKYKNLAILKSAFGKLAVDSLFLMSKYQNLSKYKLLIEAYEHFSIGMQLYDDFTDIDDDIEKGQLNWAVLEHSEHILKNKIEINEKNYKKSFYIEGTIKNVLLLALNYFESSLKLIKKSNCSNFQTVINQIVEKINLGIWNIDNQLLISSYKSKQSKKVHKQQNINESIKLGLDYILARQTKEGYWEEYINQGGISNQWATAYIICNLNPFKSQKKVENSCKKGLKFLNSQNRNLGWSYSSTWIPDADSINFGMLANILMNQTVPQTIIQNWFSFQKPMGLFSTYNDENTILSNLKDPAILDVRGWINGHQCVSAVSFYILALNNFTPEILFKLNKYFYKSLKMRTINAYWWTSEIYTFYYLSKAYFHLQNKPALNLIRNQVKKIYQKIKENLNVSNGLFYDAMVIEILILTNDNSELLHSIINKILGEQYDDGSWRGSDALMVPPPFLIDSSQYVNNFPILSYGTGVRCEEFNRLFTTAGCLNSLNSFMNKNW